jgi:hypothetical protein
VIERFGLLSVAPGKRERIESQFQHVLRCDEVHEIDYCMRLDRCELEALVAMTPNAWHMSSETAAVISAVRTIDTRVACTVMCFRHLCGIPKTQASLFGIDCASASSTSAGNRSAPGVVDQ